MGPTIQFDVIDSGPGIAEEFHDQIFERFRQAAPIGAQRYGGTGLGLALARSLAQAMQGSLIVQSQLGAGSQFTLRLPMRPAGIDLENLPRTPIRKVTPTSVSMPP
jgi:signal transduction histidine kinase